MKEKLWHISPRISNENIEKISKTLGISFPIAFLLHERGYKTPEEASAFIRLEDELFHDPFLMKDMDKAAGRIVYAIEKGEKTVIYGDYDVDGVTSVCLLCLYLREKGLDVSYYIPNRVGEGYGVNKEAIKKLYDNGNSLIVTVDTGITAIDEAAYASEIGCDMVITDHHQCREEIPDAVAVINPRRQDCSYPFKELAGVGVAFKLVCAVEYILRKNRGETEGFLSHVCKNYIDLVALGTVADVMPLTDENRLIVSMGISMMERSPRPGITALLDAADGGKNKKRKISSSVIGFTVAPRINAAGRMSSASKAAELFLCQSPSESQRIAAELCEINTERQLEENRIVSSLKSRIEESINNNLPVIVLDDDGWNHGVIGIVSSRITEKYGRPSILISFENDVGKGSGRSVHGMNLVEALSYCSSLLTKYGGHELAAGLTVSRENLEAFKEKINEYAVTKLGSGQVQAKLDVDLELYPEEISLCLASELDLLEPFGTANPTPTFCTLGLKVIEISEMGQGKHTKLLLERDGRRFPALMFGTGADELSFAKGDTVDIAFRLGVNEFRGVRSEQIMVKDVRISDSLRAERNAEHELYKKAASEGEVLSEWIPVRGDFVAAYLHLKRSLPENGGEINIRSLLNALSSTRGSSEMNYIKLRFILDILNESGVLTVKEKQEGERFALQMPHIETKVNLELSCIYKQLISRKNRNTKE